MHAAPPFVLLDDARPGAPPARLYADPVEIVTTRKPGDLRAALDALRVATRGGLHAAGYVAYAAGAALEDTLISGEPADAPLLWFGLFRGWQAIDAHAWLPDAAGAWAGAPVPDISRSQYGAALARVKALIEAGDIYQANLTFQATVAIAGHPLALYAGLRARSASGYGAVVATGSTWMLSLSPELFFTIERGRIVTRPMKGTAPADSDPAALAADPKQRAENLMIVDLLRNDLSRVATPGSVAVPELFAVEAYPTLLQMTSTITAELDPQHDAIDALAALFPCGSITGAPKIRAMEIIAEVEAAPRGVYTGAIGRLDPDGEAAFNVAIRTLTLTEGAQTASMGLGSGIVADSEVDSEWAECLAKGAFVASARRFDLIETMRFEPAHGIRLIDRHMARMKRSARRLGFTFDSHHARNALHMATFRLKQARRVRLTLSPTGAVAVEVHALPAASRAPVDVRLVPLTVDPHDMRLCHKTSDRAFYDAARGGAFETVFVRPDGLVTEGSFTNVFVDTGSILVTPPCTDGLLGGVLRAELLGTGKAIEGELTVRDLNDGFLIGNALRGLLPARLTQV